MGNVLARSEVVAPEIGERITALRERLGLSVADLASALGLKPFAVREIEKGRNVSQWVKVIDLARTLGVTPNDILGYGQHQEHTVDPLDMMGAAVQVMLIGDGWARERAEALVDIATEVAAEKSELDLDRRLAEAFRKRALKQHP